MLSGFEGSMMFTIVVRCENGGIMVVVVVRLMNDSTLQGTGFEFLSLAATGRFPTLEGIGL
jgi:hypothetical protein